MLVRRAGCRSARSCCAKRQSGGARLDTTLDDREELPGTGPALRSWEIPTADQFEGRDAGDPWGTREPIFTLSACGRLGAVPFGYRSARFAKPLANDVRVVLGMAEAFSSHRAHYAPMLLPQD